MEIKFQLNINKHQINFDFMHNLWTFIHVPVNKFKIHYVYSLVAANNLHAQENEKCELAHVFSFDNWFEKQVNIKNDAEHKYNSCI